MTDTISRQDAIDATWFEPSYTDPLNVLTEVRDRLKALPSAQPEQRWIPCSERLPETSGTYLVSGMWASGRVAVGDCEYSIYDGYFDTSWNFDVLAWMPLPEPWEGEGNERA